MNTRNLPLMTVSVGSTLSILYFSYRIWSNCVEPKKKPWFIPSPLHTIQDHVDAPYPPNAFPGARDIDSPWGTTRAYELGPESGHKVLLVHGISTPCVALGELAWSLVKLGYRVCLYDLWGRGYSDSPLMPHDEGLYVMQMHMVLNSSPLSWTGTKSGGFSIVGYSLGGGLVMSFAACHPELVINIVIMGPGGILRSQHPSLDTLPLRHPNLFPKAYLKNVCERLLCGGLEAPAGTDSPATQLAPDVDSPPEMPTSPPEKILNVEEVVRWQIHHHPGFVHSFVSSLAHAPVKGHHEEWRKVAVNLTRANKKLDTPRKVLLLVADKDPFSPKETVVPDAIDILGSEILQVECMKDIGHEFAVACGQRVAHIIVDSWNNRVTTRLGNEE